MVIAPDTRRVWALEVWLTPVADGTAEPVREVDLDRVTRLDDDGNAVVTVLDERAEVAPMGPAAPEGAGDNASSRAADW